MKSTLLILGAGQMQLPAIQTAKSMGLRVIAIDPDPKAPGLALADFSYTFDLGKIDKCLAIARRHAIHAVLSLASEYPIPTIAALCQVLDLSGLNPLTAEGATNKRVMRELLAKADVPIPRSVAVYNLSQAKSSCANTPGEKIVKPVMSHGGRGVTQLSACATGQQISTAFNHALKSTRAAGVLIEEFVPGPEFSVEAMTFNGITKIVAITDKLTSGPPHFVELGHSQPTQLDKEQSSQLEQITRKAIHAIGIDWSPSHTEIKLTPQGPKVIEIGARLGGGFITSHLVPYSTGVDMVKASIQLALGQSPDIEIKHNKGAAVGFITAPTGQITSLQGMERCLCSLGLKSMSLYVSQGDQVCELKDASGRLGHIICTAADPKAALARVEMAKNEIEIRVQKESA